MSNKEQTSRDKEFEVNLTPIGVVRQGLSTLKKRWGLEVNTFLDPSAGGGVYCQVVRELWPDAYIVACEAREEQRGVLSSVADEVFIGEFDVNQLTKWNFDLISSNTPFSKTRYWVADVYASFTSGHLVFLDKTQAFQRSVAGVGFLFEYVPLLELRIGQGIQFREKSGTDGVCYSHWCWDLADRVVVNPEAGELPEWTSVQLPLLSAAERKYR